MKGITSIIAMVVSFAMVIIGILQLGGNMMDFLDGPSFMIVIIPTIGCLAANFPLSLLLGVPSHFKILLKGEGKPEVYVGKIVDIAKKARQEGLLSLENEQMDLPIAQYALRMIVDGVQDSDVRESLEDSLASMKRRHDEVIGFYEKGGTYSPAFGMIGTVLSLINMLKNLNFEDPTAINSLGVNMAAALITTLYGSMFANIIFIPIAGKLKSIHQKEVFSMTLVCNGLLAVLRGSNPNILQDYLREQLSRKTLKLEVGGGDLKMKNDDEEQGSQGEAGWLTTYADMVTLLFAFFVLLFAISNVDAQKFQLLAKALSRDGITAEDFIEIQKEYDMQGMGMPDPEDLQYPSPDDEQGHAGTPEDKTLEEMLAAQLESLFQMITEYINQNNLADSISVSHNGDHLMLMLTNDVWFDSGKATVKPAMVEIAKVLARLLADTQDRDNPYDVVVAGHTDNVPMNTPEFPSNWRLSVGRATNFIEILIDESGLDPYNFDARGAGEWRPIDTNDTDDGRQRNRRVEVLISHIRQLGQSDEQPDEQPPPEE